MALIKIKVALACLLALGLFAAGSGATGWLVPGLSLADTRAGAAAKTGPPMPAKAPMPDLPGIMGQPAQKLPKTQTPKPVADLRGPMLVLNEQVAAELKLSADQIRQIKVLHDRVEDKYKHDVARFAPDKVPRSGAALTRTASRTSLGEQEKEIQAMRKFQEEHKKVLSALSTEERQALNEALPGILAPEQLKRLGQIDLRSMNLHAFSDQRVVNALHLAGEQKLQVERVSLQGTVAISVSLPRGGIVVGDEIDDVEKKVRAVTAEWMGKIVALLTPEQRQAWDELIGPPFEFHWPKAPHTEPAAVVPGSRPSGFLAGAMLAGLIILSSVVALLYARRPRLAGKENGGRTWRDGPSGILFGVRPGPWMATDANGPGRRSD